MALVFKGCSHFLWGDGQVLDRCRSSYSYSAYLLYQGLLGVSPYSSPVPSSMWNLWLDTPDWMQVSSKRYPWTCRIPFLCTTHFPIKLSGAWCRRDIRRSGPLPHQLPHNPQNKRDHWSPFLLLPLWKLFPPSVPSFCLQQQAQYQSGTGSHIATMTLIDIQSRSW